MNWFWKIRFKDPTSGIIKIITWPEVVEWLKTQKGEDICYGDTIIFTGKYIIDDQDNYRSRDNLIWKVIKSNQFDWFVVYAEVIDNNTRAIKWDNCFELSDISNIELINTVE